MTSLKTRLQTLAASGAAALAVALTASAAHAAVTVLVFDDFEGYGNANITDFSGFTDLHVEDGSVDLIGTPNPWALHTGYQSAFVDLDGTADPANGGLLRTDVFTLVEGQRYTLSFALSGNQRSGADPWDFGFQSATADNISFNNVVVAGYGLDLAPVCTDCTSLAIGAGSSALSYLSGWHNYSISFTAGSGGSFTAYVATDSNDNVGPLVDNFQLAAVPEPASWALMLLGFGGLGAILRRRRQPAFALQG